MPSIAAVTEIGSAVARTSAAIVYEKITRPRPTTLDQVPPSPSALTTEWLTAALCAGTPGARVEGFTLGSKNDGTSARRTLEVTYNAAGGAAGLPTHLFTKSSPTLLTRLVTTTANLLPSEHAFYSAIRRELNIEAPTGFYAAWDPRSNRSLFIIDDVTRTRGAKTDTILTRHFSREQAEDAIDLLATLHAAYWDRPGLARRFGWLMDPYSWQLRINKLMMMDRNAVVGFDRSEHVMPREIYLRKHDFIGALLRSRQISADGPRTIVHSDVHAGNWYLTGDGRVGLFDWQCMLHGFGAQDIAYALIGNLTIEHRRAWERDLVELYRERLRERGATDVPDSETLWLRYRQMVPHAMFMWLGTIGANKMQPQMQKREISLANIERSAQACADLDAFGALGM
ncbi:aminoglycoside phosphotransferase family protein [Mycobacterium sp.]|uniref:aminoglycoside phosphotransferase family protein n=1 Tax=Mycobacterium sp. TaxID=1785 RepID=UPI0025FC0C01|nr:aminoglycoside phosphotransferase family protein [Mycobacterium sp.]